MGTITTGVGLISGLNTADIIKQLMAIEARPVDQLKARVTATNEQKLALLDLTARITAIKNAAGRFDETSFFRSVKATSSDEATLTATASDGAAPGSYTFQVRSLATNHQIIARGMADKDQTPVGAGTLTIEMGDGALNPATSLDMLNEGDGVRRGVIRITDRSGRAADIDLTAAFTVDDVLMAINSRLDVNVRASVQADRIVITDLSGGSGDLRVTDVGGGQTASDLGIAGVTSDGRVVGRAVLRLGMNTALRVLNDGAGVRTDGAMDDFSVTLRDGTAVAVNLSGRLRFATRLEELNSGNGVRLGTIRLTNRAGLTGTVDLAGARTIEDVVTRINGAVDEETGESLKINISVVNASLSVADMSISANEAGASNLIIEDVTGSAARDLGIAVNVAAPSVRGSTIYRVQTLGDAIRAINYATGNDGRLVAAVGADGFRIELADRTDGAGETAITALNGSKAAYDLGLAAEGGGPVTSRRLLAGLNTVLLQSLNGGRGVGVGTIQITAGDGTVTAVDLAGAETVQDVLDAINATTGSSHVRAELSRSGLGIVVTDTSGAASAMSIADLSGTTAADLRLAATGLRRISSGSLQRRYLSETTELASLNGGRGVADGKIRITDSLGRQKSIEIQSGTDRTIGDVLKKINAAGLGVVARMNDTGDGILLEDTAGGDRLLKVEEDGGSTAADLNLKRQAAEGQTTIDGSFEIRIAVAAGDTLEDVARKINAAGGSVAATVINDGTRLDPYRLSVASRISGTAGRILLDEGDTGLSFSTLVDAQDAVVFFGAGESAAAVPIVTSSNTLSDVVDGVTLNLTGTSSRSVTVTVARDVDKILSDMNVFKKTFNDTIDRINELTRFSAESGERGILFADATVNAVKSRLYGLFSLSVAETDPSFSRLSFVGVRIGTGGKLEIDEARLRKAIEENQPEVEKLFTLQKEAEGKLQQLGAGYRIQKVLDDLASPTGGLLARQKDLLTNREELFNKRIAYMEELLARKQKRLEADFQAMEKALAAIQTQQTALSQLATLASSYSVAGLSGS